MLQANSTVTPAQIYMSLQNGALPMGGATGFNFNSGFGFVQADTAFGVITSHRPTSPNPNVGRILPRRRQFDDDYMVLGQRVELYGIRNLERCAGDERNANRHARSGGRRPLHVNLRQRHGNLGSRDRDFECHSRCHHDPSGCLNGWWRRQSRLDSGAGACRLGFRPL